LLYRFGWFWCGSARADSDGDTAHAIAAETAVRSESIFIQRRVLLDKDNFVRVFLQITFLLFTEVMVSAQTCLSAPPGGLTTGVVAGASTQPAAVAPDKVAVVQQESETTSQNNNGGVPDEPATMFRHSNSSPFWLSGQTNVIFQAHPPFHAAYSGPNSLSNAGEYKTSLLGTLFLGVQVPGTHDRTEFLLDFESAGGRGISQALGLAGFTNLDVVRNPTLSSEPYVARLQLHQILPLSKNTTEASRSAMSLATKVPVRRLEFRVGKMSAPDSFDVNAIGSDSHLQFTNWTVDNNGAYDYAADTRGYTYGAVVEFQDRIWAARYGLMLMPTVANGIHLDWNLRRARGENVEFELRKGVWWHKPGVIRVLSYVNHAHMGSYREAVSAFLDGSDPVPDITKHEHFGAVKYGFGVNTEQQISDNLRLFARFGWNEGQHESFAYTEVDQTVAAGGDYSGRRWRRPLDKVGIAFVSNAIKKDHQLYLKYGGLGFLLGDGNLTYGRENILETYYNLHTWRGLFYALGASYVANPGYNRDRGPVIVPSIRMHVDF
jgi:high affinity Mn2+ porin